MLFWISKKNQNNVFQKRYIKPIYLFLSRHNTVLCWKTFNHTFMQSGISCNVLCEPLRKNQFHVNVQNHCQFANCSQVLSKYNMFVSINTEQHIPAYLQVFESLAKLTLISYPNHWLIYPKYSQIAQIYVQLTQSQGP